VQQTLKLENLGRNDQKENPMLTPFGKAIRKMRIDLAITLKEMAERLGVTPAYLSAVETGKKRVTDDLLDKIEEHYSLSAIEARDLRRQADQSASVIKLKMNGTDNGIREMATVFSRRFSDLEEKEVQEIMNILNKKKSQGDG
jgi:transcriptional regulator with XRE-family HTH domain